MGTARQLQEARVRLGRGELREAERCLHGVLAADSANPDAQHLLGLVALRQGETSAARLHLEAAVAARPDSGEIRAHLTEVLRRLGEHEAAIAEGREAVRLVPQAAASHNNLGLALQGAGRLEPARAAFRRAADLDPTYARARYNLGNVLRELDRPQEAEASLRAALELQPRYPQALNALGVVLGELGRADEASESFQRAAELAPGYAKPFLNYGNLLASLERVSEAERCYERALEVQPEYPEAWLAKATLYERLERWDEALEAVRRAGRLRPGDPEVAFRCGQVHFSRFDFLEAMTWFERVLALDPEHRGAVCALAQARGEACSWQERDRDLAAVRGAIRAAREEGEDCPIPPFVSFLPFAPEELLDLARDASARIFREAAIDREALGPPGIAIRAGSGSPRRIRLGYLSSDFRYHAVAQMTRGLYRLHDRERFEVRAYSLGPDDGSEFRRGIAADCDAFVDLRGATDTDAARRIRADGVDILVDLAGFTRGGRPGIPARRPAPIQVSWLYPASMGGVFQDYLISDEVVTPIEHHERFGEQLVLMPHCYHVTDGEQELGEHTPTRAEEGLPEKGFVFCCFNKLAKIDPETFGSWMRILRQVPGSVLWIGDGLGVDNLRREAERRGVSGDRLRARRFADTKAQHLARHRLADLFLDTRVFCGHTTAADSLWAGVPLLTCPGETFASRVAASMLTAVGLPELVMPDPEAYGQRAVELARSGDELGALRRRLAEQRKEWPLFDTPRFVHHLEQAYRRMWSRLEDGREPTTLIVTEEG